MNDLLIYRHDVTFLEHQTRNITSTLLISGLIFAPHTTTYAGRNVTSQFAQRDSNTSLWGSQRTSPVQENRNIPQAGSKQWVWASLDRLPEHRWGDECVQMIWFGWPHSSSLWTTPGVFGTHQNYLRCPSALATDETKNASIKDRMRESPLLHHVEGCSRGGTSLGSYCG